ncbi:hypothetical protein [Streptomyces sp. NPDC056049]|uniref:hypothetical protein n=1 Tax=Streptomyces sp. NPDC056049 TaxID=3345693 RepID=UPI0035DF3A9F
MTQPNDDTRHERLRLHEIASLDDHDFDRYIEERFDQLVTAAIADADGWLRPEQHTALHAPGRLLQLHDALTFAQGDLQVAAERMTYHGDARAARTARLLRRVRTALHEVTRKTTAVRREEGRQREAEATPPSTDVIVMARNWLVEALPDHFNRLLTRTFAEAGFPLRPAAADVFGTVEEGWDDGLLPEPRTQQVDELLAKGAVAFRGLVADDVRSQNARTTALRHPLLQRRWAQALDELAELTIPVAQASSSSALGQLPAGVTTCQRPTRTRSSTRAASSPPSGSAKLNTSTSSATTPPPSPNAAALPRNTTGAAGPSRQPSTASSTSSRPPPLASSSACSRTPPTTA